VRASRILVRHFEHAIRRTILVRHMVNGRAVA